MRRVGGLLRRLQALAWRPVLGVQTRRPVGHPAAPPPAAGLLQGDGQVLAPPPWSVGEKLPGFVPARGHPGVTPSTPGVPSL